MSDYESLPVLPHERQLLRAIIAEGLNENDAAAAAMMKAFEDPNREHDNAEYDAVLGQMRSIDARYTPIAQAFGRIALVEYPQPKDGSVTIGSLVKIDFEGEEEFVVVVGFMSPIIRQTYEKAWERAGYNGEVTFLSPATPQGQSLLGAKVGETVSYSVQTSTERIFQMEIKEIDQEWVRQKLGGIA